MWLSKTGEVNYPIGQEVGCRIELHNLGKTKVAAILLKEFLAIYGLEKPRSHQNQGRYHQILALLKNEKNSSCRAMWFLVPTISIA